MTPTTPNETLSDPGASHLVPAQTHEAVQAHPAGAARHNACGTPYSWWQSTPFLSVLCFVLLGAWFYTVHRRYYFYRLPFDDAFMFYRYAAELRMGNGVAWNPGDAPTYGVTSPLWLACISVASFFSRSSLHVVVASSTLSGVLAMAVTAWAVTTNAISTHLRRLAFTVACVLGCCLCMFCFLDSAANGMETSLSFAMLALLAGTVERWRNARAHWFWCSLAGFLASLCRPESALATCILLALAWWWLPKPRRWEAWSALGLFLGILAGQWLACKLYFHTPLPLSFYLKSQHSYVGYIGRWSPVALLLENLRSCRAPLILLALFATWKDRRLLLTYLLPAAACMLYLTTTLQIMGFWSRYYVPYSALILIPALLLLDRRWAEGNLNLAFVLRAPAKRSLLVALCACLALGIVPHRLINWLDDRSEGPIVAYDPPRFTMPQPQPLPPMPVKTLLLDMGDKLVARLPAGSSVAASEVGYIAAQAPRVKIIDIVGLNDTTIARQGFHMDTLLAQEPDIIWFPHPDYTYQRGVMMSDPRLLREYDFYPEVANFGLAVRKTGRYHAQVEAAFQQFWQQMYPAQQPAAFRALGVFWDGKRRTVTP